MPNEREARLKREFARLIPGSNPGFGTMPPGCRPASSPGSRAMAGRSLWHTWSTSSTLSSGAESPGASQSLGSDSFSCLMAGNRSPAPTVHSPWPACHPVVGITAMVERLAKLPIAETRLGRG